MRSSNHPTELGAGERWYVVQCLARREAYADQNLRAQGFRTFSPSFLKTVRHARQFRTARQALFPGYLFIILDLEKDRWRCVNGTFGVSRLVMGVNHPQPVPKGIVERIYENVDNKGLVSLKPNMRAGDAISIVSGPFTDMLGEIIGLDDRGRARVLLDIVSGRVVVDIEQDSLRCA